MNEILVRRKNKVILKNKSDRSNIILNPYVVTIMKNVESLGYTFSEELFYQLQSVTMDGLKQFNDEIVTILKDLVGANVIYRPMYPNFPESVMERDDVELYINAMIHYWSSGKILPNETKNPRTPLFEETKVKILDLGTKDDLVDIFNNLASSKTSLSGKDKEDLITFIKTPGFKIPDKIPYKENVALICGIIIAGSRWSQFTTVMDNVKTATDLLRVITSMSDGDVSLAENTRYRSFKRIERTFFLSLLDHMTSIEEDMLRYKAKWIRIGERLHPAEYKADYPKAAEAFSKLRNNEKIETFNSKVTAAIDSRDLDATLKLLKARPGEFARKLDFLLRIFSDNQMIVSAFEEIADDVSTPVLLQVRSHFKDRLSKEEKNPRLRIFFPKGNVAKAHCRPDDLDEIEEEYVRHIVAICKSALNHNYGKREPMGNVYISDSYKDYLVPFSQRSASEALKTIVRGSKITANANTNTVRAFIWWTNMNNGNVIDIDLSVGLFAENWNFVERVSYTRLTDYHEQIGTIAVHSGDITNGGKYEGDGVCEFLDINIDNVLKRGARYVAFQVYSFSKIPFNKLNCMFGWMERENMCSGELFEPKTVIQKANLMADSSTAIPVIFDCVDRKFIWCDLSKSLNAADTGNNIENNLTGVSMMCYGISNMVKPTLYELMCLNANARGTIVETKEDADIIFDVNEGITPFDVDEFMGKYI